LLARHPPWSVSVDSQPPLVHVSQINLIGPNARPENIVGKREDNIEVSVQVSVVEAVVSGEELVDRPGAEELLFRLVHLEMNLVPCPMVKDHDPHKDCRSEPGEQRNEHRKGKRLEWRLVDGEPYLSVFTLRDGFIAEDRGVVGVMHESVGLIYSLEARGTLTEEVPSVHQVPVHLMLDERRQNAGEDQPATNFQQNRHESLPSLPWPMAAVTASASSAADATRPEMGLGGIWFA